MNIVATVNSIKFRGDSGWTVVNFVDETNLKFVGVGMMPAVFEGEKLELAGEWKVHKVYGRQFSVESVSPVPLAGREALVSYLSSGMIKGVGLPTARAIVNEFGEDALDVIKNFPSRLEKLPGIGMIKSKMIHDSYMEKVGVHEIFMGLNELGLTVNQANKVFKLYGENAVRFIRENPYRLIADVESIGFKTADKIAEKAGIDHDSPFRIKAGIRYVLSEARNDGNTCLPKEIVIMRAANEVLGVEIDPTEQAAEGMIMSGELIEKHIDGEDMLFLSYLYSHELDSAVGLFDIMNNARVIRLFDLDGEIDSLEKKYGVELDEVQREAVRKAFTDGVLVITGGPGTGKTTILRFIIEILERLELKYELAAPTGRAAKRITDTTGREARTIHRLLGYGGQGGETFRMDESNTLKADAVIIDEMSMVDISLFHSLVKAISEGTRLIMVGDFDQLPSVGPGNVLRDLILSDTLPVVRLTVIHRQAGRSMIVLNAHRINSGRLPVLSETEDDFQFISIPDMEMSLEYVVKLGRELSEKGESDFQILAPMKANIIGVNNLNLKLQEAINPPAADKRQILLGESNVLRVGDRVMQTRNNYDIEWKRLRTAEEGSGVYNGDIGTVMDIDASGNVIRILFDDERMVSFGREELEDIELAYAVSVHKSQGSEFSTVIIPLVYGPRVLMNRNILYTAVTRARNRVVIVGSAKCVEGMINNTQSAKRYSALGFFLSELSDGRGFSRE
ncbi:MAG: ATP-dependent RecD-like DNA helicase [Clostridiales bacterium]|nr:ATP-dependent RecD-like DNA helicase [Clostridiales bacterium]